MRGWEKIWHRGNAIWSRKIGGEIPDLAGRHSRESAIAVGKEFGMAEGNFVTKNARSEVKEFAIKMYYQQVLNLVFLFNEMQVEPQ